MGTSAASTSAVTIAVWVIVGLIALAIVSAALGELLVRRGRRQPFVVRLINHASDSVVDAVKRPLTVAILDEVTDVLRTGHYTRNLAAALQENREELKQMIAEKIKEDPAAGRISLLPFHDRLIEQASETTLRVMFEVLADPRTDELVSDLLRNNIEQIKQAVRDRQAD